ncbi:hypothetical protein Cgig2_022697 [Carnegiea gigantea]|uniref:Uncharacterized protein n=1 Tax=Carnegiea gigantea TaxID=171969 RepID=A0A9Q1Q6G6_9CARY|nr:hypothetical protein Cgig2_022697 [Carnegiea gigantea]
MDTGGFVGRVLPLRPPISSQPPSLSALVTPSIATSSIAEFHFFIPALSQSWVTPSIDPVLGLQSIFKQKSHHLRQFSLQWSNDAVSAACFSCLCFFGGNPSRKETRAEGGPSREISSRSPSSRRRWTNFLLAVNVLVYVTQIATQGKLKLWGAKVRSQNRNYR